MRDLTLFDDNYPLSAQCASPADQPKEDGCRLQSIAQLPASVQQMLAASRSANTCRAYRSDLAAFAASGGAIPASEEQVASYIAEASTNLAPATLARRLVAIASAHRAQGFSNPCRSELVHATMRGVRRIRGTAQRTVEPVTRQQLAAMLDAVPRDLRGTRDQAILALGFSGGFRRSELANLTVRDIRFVDEGMLVSLAKSKTDQSGVGRMVAIPRGRSLCAVTLVSAWITLQASTDGPLFRRAGRTTLIGDLPVSGAYIAVLVKRSALAIGLNPALYSGHSLRAGFVTAAAEAGVSAWKIRQQTGHRSDAMLERYIRSRDLFKNNASGSVL